MRFVFLLSALFLLSCQNKESNKDVNSISSKFSVHLVEENGLKIKYENDIWQKLKTEGQISNYLLSSDSLNMAVNVRLTSEINVIQVYRMNDRGVFEVDTISHITSTAWNSACENKAIHLEDILWPRIEVTSWTEDNSGLNVDVSGTYDGQEIDTTFTIDIK